MARWILRAAAVLLVGTAVTLAAGQAGLFAGTAPAGLGVSNGRLALPSPTPNSVSSQAALYPDHPQHLYAAMEPLRFAGDGEQALRRLEKLVGGLERVRIVERREDYLRAEASSRWMGFRDDVEFWLDAPAGRVHFRSASRLGRSDLGVNRARMENIRARWSP